ncbi:hypothetical protein C9374_004651 [Naegleria lovaniensis]|uniref:Protein kinase domain-containing protein n=1 Tax=Naegleria lovaniensis TaxID=51637 RepID=A0AA88KIX2_NAELO|nr:uncharacterized protein C9374_004651 [Naegleria lovaniensis]KAG2383314.1 hypothetical protein C9374_004651 [Naegleria lovaniensis]
MSSPPVRFLSNFLSKSPQGLSPLATSPTHRTNNTITPFVSSSNSSSALTSSTTYSHHLILSSTPLYTLNDLPDDVYFLIASFLIPRVPQLCDSNVRLNIGIMINLSSISMHWREWAETITVQQNFWRDFLFQEMIRRNIRLSLVHASTFFQNSSSANNTTSSNSNSSSNSGVKRKNSVLEDVIRREKELRLDYMMNGGLKNGSYYEAEVLNDDVGDDDDDDYFADDVGGVVGGFNDMNSLLRRGDYLSYTSGDLQPHKEFFLKLPYNTNCVTWGASTDYDSEIIISSPIGYNREMNCHFGLVFGRTVKRVTFQNLKIEGARIYGSSFINSTVKVKLINGVGSSIEIFDSLVTTSGMSFEEIEQFSIRNTKFIDSWLACENCESVEIDNVQVSGMNNEAGISFITNANTIQVFNSIFSSPLSVDTVNTMHVSDSIFEFSPFLDRIDDKRPDSNLWISLVFNCTITRSKIRNSHDFPAVRFQLIGELHLYDIEVTNNSCVNCMQRQEIIFLKSCSEARITNSLFTNNAAGKTGVLSAEHSRVYFSSCLFENNTSLQDGAAIVATYTTVKIEDSVFRNNVAMTGNGGAIYLHDRIIQSSSIPTSLQILNTILSKNHALNGKGGAVYSNGATIYMFDTLFSNNSALISGGAVSSDLSPRSIIFSCQFLHNTVLTSIAAQNVSDGWGGALISMNVVEPLSVERSVFENNVALFGGAISCEASTSIIETKIQNNIAHFGGGGIFLTSRGDLRFFEREIGKSYKNNSALLYGHNVGSPVTQFSIQTEECGSSSDAPSKSAVYFGEDFCIRFYGLKDVWGNSVPMLMENVKVLSLEQQVLLVTPLTSSGNVLSSKLKLVQNSKFDSIQRFRVETYLVSTEFSLTIRDCPTDWIIENGICTQGIRFSLIIPLVIFGGISAMLLSFVLGIFMSFHFVKLLIWLRKIYKRERVEKDIEKKLLDYDFGNLTNEGILTTNHSLHHDHDSSQHQQGDYYELETCSDIHSLSNKKKKHLPLLSSFSKNSSSNALSLIIPSSELKFEKKIGEGASGSVYLAQWNSNRVAVKTLSRDDDYSSMDEFEKEITVLIQLRHPNIINFYGIFISEFKKYMVVEYLQGGSLDNLIKKMKNQNVIISMKEKMKILIGIASGMKYLHNLQPAIIHRDLKPGNILLTSDYTAKIADFGLSKTISMNTCNSLTTNIGTLFYMAPELLLGTDISSENVQEYATKTDVFSFSIIMWELLFEENPYHNDDSQKIHFFSNQHDRNKNGSNNSRKHVNSLNFLSLILKEGNRPIIPFKSNSNNHSHHHHDENTAMNSSVNDNNNNNITWQMEDETEMKIWCEKFLQNSSPPFLSFMKGYISLMEECWNEDPLQRPGFNRILEILYTLNNFSNY